MEQQELVKLYATFRVSHFKVGYLSYLEIESKDLISVVITLAASILEFKESPHG